MKPVSPNLSALSAEAPPEPMLRRLFIFLGYLLLGVIFTWPLVLNFGDSVIQKGGLPVDAGQGVWNLWWTRSALLQGLNPFTTDYLFYPLQIGLFFQTLSLPNGLLASPVLFSLGPVAAFNTITLLSFAMGGYFAYRLAHSYLGDTPAALVAGFVFAFTPYHMQRVWSGPMELIAIHWLPIYVLLLVRALARPQPLRLFAAALALLVTTLASQYYGLYAAIYTAFHCLLAALIAQRGLRLRTLLAGAGVGVLWLLCLSPFLFAVGGIESAVLEDWYERQVYHSLALIDLVVPNIQHPLWGAQAAAWQQSLHPFGLEGGGGFGLSIYLLCAMALWRRWQRSWPWLLLAFGMLLFALGPQLRLTEAASPIPGPFLLLDYLGPFRNSSRPSVFLALMLIPMAMLAAEGIASLRQLNITSKPSSASFAWVLIGLLLAENLVAPWPLTRLQAAPAYAELQSDPIPGAVLELPPRNNDSQYLLNQICHARPLVGGYLARLPDYPLARYPSALKNLWDANAPAPDMLELNPAAELATLGVRYVTLDLTQLPRSQAGRLREQLSQPGISLASADEQREIYAIDPQLARPVAILGPGWYDAETDGTRAWRWMQGEAGIILMASHESLIQLSFSATAYTQNRTLQIWQGEQQLAEFPIAAAPYDTPITLRLAIPAGQTSLRLISPATTSPEGRQLSLSIGSLELIPLQQAGVPLESVRPPATLLATGSAPCN